MLEMNVLVFLVPLEVAQVAACSQAARRMCRSGDPGQLLIAHLHVTSLDSVGAAHAANIRTLDLASWRTPNDCRGRHSYIRTPNGNYVLKAHALVQRMLGMLQKMPNVQKVVLMRFGDRN